jgi:hypothetical protein
MLRLLSQESHLSEYRARLFGREFEARAEIGILLHQLRCSLRREQVARLARRFKAAECGFGLQCALAERRQLLTEVPDELLQLRQRVGFRK